MLLTNGRIYLMDAWDTVVDTLVVRDGRVAFAGRRSEVNVAGAEEIVDLGGRAVVPGLVDAHGHLMHLARGRLTLDADGARSEAEVAERVVLGGGVLARAGLRERVRAGVGELLGGYVRSATIVAPELGDRSGVLGALALAHDLGHG